MNKGATERAHAVQLRAQPLGGRERERGHAEREQRMVHREAAGETSTSRDSPTWPALVGVLIVICLCLLLMSLNCRQASVCPGVRV